MTALVDVLSHLQQHNDMTDIDEREKEEKEVKHGQYLTINAVCEN